MSLYERKEHICLDLCQIRAHIMHKELMAPLIVFYLLNGDDTEQN